MGKRLFAEIGCVDCHRPKWRTGSSHPVAALRDRNIYPYSDLLLHNMGEELAGARSPRGYPHVSRVERGRTLGALALGGEEAALRRRLAARIAIVGVGGVRRGPAAFELLLCGARAGPAPAGACGAAAVAPSCPRVMRVPGSRRVTRGCPLGRSSSSSDSSRLSHML